jgi:hypothetical protein
MIRTTVKYFWVAAALSLVACASTRPKADSASVEHEERGTGATVVGEQASAGDDAVEPGEDWLFWAEGDVFIVDGDVWWTGDDLNRRLAKSPPRVPAELRGMQPEAARKVVNSFVAASIRVKANKALVDWHLDESGARATDEQTQTWFDGVQELVAGPEERQILARFAGRDKPLVNDEGMRRAAERNARLAQLMSAAGLELATRQDAEKIYEAEPRAWQIPGAWKIHLVECPSVDRCDAFRSAVIETPGDFTAKASELKDHGEVTLRAQAGTPARPLLNAFETHESGAITPVVELGGSVWIARLVERRAPYVPEFEEVADTIVANQHIGALNQFEDALVEQLLADHDVKIMWDNVRFRLGDEVATLQPPKRAEEAKQ